MKCLGAEFHDEADIRYLLRHRNLTVYQDVVTLFERYHPLERFPQKTPHALEEILGESEKTGQRRLLLAATGAGA